MNDNERMSDIHLLISLANKLVRECAKIGPLPVNDVSELDDKTHAAYWQANCLYMSSLLLKTLNDLDTDD